jgi:hypothetical protein
MKSRFFDPRTRCHSNSEFSASFPTDSQQNLRMHVYEVRPRKDHRDVNLISDALPFVGCGTVSQAQSATQLTTRSFAVAHITL